MMLTKADIDNNFGFLLSALPPKYRHFANMLKDQALLALDLQANLDAAQKDVARLNKRAANQRRELRRLNKYLGPYWAGFRRGLANEAECKLRGIMIQTFGHEKVIAAEHAAIDTRTGEGA
jgi:hypothetical protein